MLFDRRDHTGERAVLSFVINNAVGLDR